jgi:lipooligosaccharide transport system permease protein
VTALGVGSARSSTRRRTRPGGVPYLDYVAPGLLAAAAMQTATIESSWPVMAAIKWSRVYHAMIATPLTERDAFVGHQLFVITRVFTVRRRLSRRDRGVRAPSPPGGASSSSRAAC